MNKILLSMKFIIWLKIQELQILINQEIMLILGIMG